MKTALLLVAFLSAVALQGANSCLKCHEGIEDIREPHSKMMREIYKVAQKAGHPLNDCIVCHGGNPNSIVKERAHSGTVGYFLNHKGPKAFYPAPGAPRINENTCGMCHVEQLKAQSRSLMNTEADKIHGAEWGFGIAKDYSHPHSAYDVENPDDPRQRLGTEAYRNYMAQLSAHEPQGFPKAQTRIPPAATADEVEQNVSLSVYTYLRQNRLRRDTGGKGCASCHIPYADKGYYEGGDSSIDKNATGHLLVHTIQSTRDAKVKVHDVEYSGVPVETCSACHNRGKRIGVSYRGLMETPYRGPWDQDGDGRHPMQTKRYLHMQEDVHYRKGMLCQDCHTSNDLHGDGFLSGANLGAVEVECQDCHGTTKAYPWELPLGYGDEFGLKPKQGPGRGVATTVAAYLKQGSVEDAPEGYLLSARGNPLVHTERKGEQVVVHLASGKDLTLTPLKALKMQGRLSEAALSAMDRIAAHTDTLECYACHAAWAPQRYGSRMKIDYSGGKQAMNHPADLPEHNLSGMTDEMPDAEHSFTEGKVTETPSYLRWENPPLSVNGEGRVSPTIPGYQVALTVIGQEGKAIVENAIPKTPDAEGAGEAGRNAITMAAVQPHTITKRSRSCESCHSDPKAAGYGTDHGRLRPDLTRDTVIDLMTADGRVLSHNTEVRIAGIAGLKDDWDRFVDENGTPLQTVGSDWRLSSPLSNAQRSRLDRSGVCLSCHKSIPEGDPAVGVMAHMAQFAGVKVDNDLHHMVLNKSMRVGAWAQLIGGAIGVLFILYLLKIIFFGSRKKERRWK